MLQSPGVDDRRRAARRLAVVALLLLLSCFALEAQEPPSEFKIQPPEDIGYLKVPVRIMDRSTFDAYALVPGGGATATISYTVTRSGRVRIRLLHRDRREIVLRTIRDWTESKYGVRYESPWDGLDASGNPVPRASRYFSFEAADRRNGGIHEHHALSECGDFGVEMVSVEIGTGVEGARAVQLRLRPEGLVESPRDRCAVRVFLEQDPVEVASCVTRDDGIVETDLLLPVDSPAAGLMVINIDDSRDHVGVATRWVDLAAPASAGETVAADEAYEELLTRADRLTEELRYEAAEELLLEARRLQPRDPRAYRLLGRVANLDGHPCRAVSHYLEFLDRDPSNVEMWTRLADAYLRMHRPERAAAALEKALELDPGDAAASTTLARMHHEAGSYDKCIAVLERLHAGGHSSAESRARLGSAYRLQGMPARAVEEYARAVASQPELAAARLGLALSLLDAGRLEQASAELRGYVRQEPDDPEGFVALGVASARAGDPEGAESLLRKALALESDHRAATLELGVVLVAQGRNEEALTLLERLKPLAPADPRLRRSLATAYQRTGQLARSRHEWEIVLRLDPTSLEARERLGLLAPTEVPPTEAPGE